MAYTTLNKVEQYTQRDLSGLSALVTTLIAAATKWINNYCGKTFESASETRYYDGNGRNRLLIDAFTGTPTEVTLLNYDGSDDTTLAEGASEDYVAYPLNATEKNELVLMPNASRGIFARAFDNILDDNPPGDFDMKRLVKVTANFGASASVPDDVSLAATMLVAKLIERGSHAGGEIQSEKLGDYSYTLKAMDEEAQIMGVNQILDAYRDIEI